MRWLLNGYTNTGTPLSSYVDEQSLVESTIRSFASLPQDELLSFVGGVDRYDPAVHGWVVIVSDDDEGRAIAAQLLPLIEHRLRVRGDDAGIVAKKIEDAVLYFPQTASSPVELARFVDQKLGYGKLGEDPPFYILVAGSPEKIPFALEQIVSAGEQCAGRLAFSSVEHYGAYARKVVAWEPDDDFACKPKRELPVALFATDHGLGDATHESLRYMVSPFEGVLRKNAMRPAVITKVKGEATTAELASLLRGDLAEFSGPRLLFSATHGLAVPGRGNEAQRVRLDRQGAIVCQNAVHLGDSEVFDASSLAQGAALDGGIWVMFACFGGGTPGASEFAGLLRDPRFLGFHQGGPFVAALPTKLLANEDGPLAIVGHLDPSFVHAFSDPSGERGGRANAIGSVFKRLLEGARIGSATSAIGSAANRYERDLRYVDQDIAQKLGKGLRDADAVQVATALAEAKKGDPLFELKQKIVDWTVSRNDFKNFVILGDPATKLPQKGATRAGAGVVANSMPQVPLGNLAPITPSLELSPLLSAAASEGRLVLPTAEEIFSEHGVEIPDNDSVVVALVASTCGDVRLRPGETEDSEGLADQTPAPFFEAVEHMACDVWAPIRLSATEVNKAADFRFELANGVTLRYGEAIAVFGDFYGIPGVQVSSGVDAFMKVFATFDRGDKYELVRILNIISEERRAVTVPGEQSSVGYKRAGLSFVEKYNVVTGGGSSITAILPKGRFLKLASDNFDHFGKSAIGAYRAGHEAALRQALVARGQASEGAQRTQLLRAYLMNACADHYLTDVFASGHLRVPRREIVEQVRVFDVALLVLKCMHDEDNRFGIKVKNRRGDRWTTYGDGKFLDKDNDIGRRLTREAVMLSAEEIWTAFETGQLPAFRALDLLPDVDDSITNAENHAPMFIVRGGVLMARENIKDRNCRTWTPRFAGALAVIQGWQR